MGAAPIRDDGSVWIPPTAAGLGNDGEEIDVEQCVKAPWDDTDSEEEEGKEQQSGDSGDDGGCSEGDEMHAGLGCASLPKPAPEDFFGCV